MPTLKPSPFTASVRWLGTVPDRGAGLESQPATALDLGFDGPPGESHAGRTRPSDSRVVAQHAKGTEIANTRQVSILSVEDLAAIAAAIGVDVLQPGWFGATLVIEGIPDFTLVPPGSRLQDEASKTTLIVDMENRPCHLVSQVLERVHPGAGKRFKPVAAHRRGITAWVERPGKIALGGTLRLHIPDQPVWPHLDAARAG